MKKFRYLALAFSAAIAFAACVAGFMLRHSLMSSCPVFTPNGMQGNASTRAPRSHARLADSAAIASVSMTSVPYGRW